MSYVATWTKVFKAKLQNHELSKVKSKEAFPFLIFVYTTKTYVQFCVCLKYNFDSTSEEDIW